jgi:hypothetical protein
MLRLAERDHDLSLPVLAAETGISKHTLATYKRDVAMPVHVLVRLSRVIPDYLTSLLFEPVEKFVGTTAPDDGDLHELAEESAEFLGEYTRSRSPKSAGGVHLVPREKENLKDRSRRIAAVARRAAA